MATQITLYPAEQKAFELLRSSPGELQKIARPDGTITIDDVYKYFEDLIRRLQYAQIQRKSEYTDVEKKAENDVV